MTKEELSEKLQKDNQEIAKNYIPNVINPIIDIYQKGVETGMTVGEGIMLNKVCHLLDKVNTDKYMDSGIFQMHDLIIDIKKMLEE